MTLARPARLALSLAVVAITAATLAHLDLDAAARATTEQHRLLKAGSFIVVARSNEPGGVVSAHGCHALARLDGFLWAGTVDERDPVATDAVPNWQFRHLGVDPIVAERWGIAPFPNEGLAAGHAAASEILGSAVGEGHVLFASQERVTVVPAEYPLLNPAADRAVLGPPLGSSIDECWAEVAPWAIEHAPSVVATFVGANPFPGPSSISTARWLRPGEFDVDPIEVFRQRSTATLQWVGFALLTCWVSIHALATRREVALYRSVGWSSLDLAVADLLSWWLMAIPAGLTALATVALLQGDNLVVGALPIAAAGVTEVVIGAGIVASLARAVVTPRRSVAAVLRA